MSRLTEEIISHQIWLQRLATQTAGLSLPFVEQMRSEVRDAVRRFGDDDRTVAKLNLMLDALDAALSGVTADWRTEVEQRLHEITAYETDWFARSLDRNTKQGVEITVPAPSSVWAGVQFAPLALGQTPAGLLELMNNWGETEKNRLLRGVQAGFVQGQTTRQIVKEVTGAGGLADVSERNAATVVRTAVAHISNSAREQVYRSNSDIVSKYQWVSTLDSRTSTTCFTAETELAPIAGMDAVMRANYSGELITVELPGGKKFTGTPEHPVLTQFGWTPLKEINPRKHILYTVVDEVTVLEVVQGINMPTRADYIFNAVANLSTGKMVSTSPTAADFYGDGVRLNGEIDIVRADCELRSYVDTSINKQVVDMQLSSVHGRRLLPGYGAEHLLFKRELSRDMTSFDKLKLADKTVENRFTNPCSLDAGSGVCTGDKHLNSPLLVDQCAATNPSSGSILHEAELLEKCSDGGCGSIITLGYDSCGIPITVCGTNIISVNSEFRTCHVYTLSSSQGYYTAGGAIVKNCRSRDGQKYDIGKGPLPPAHPNCRSTTIPVISDSYLDFLDEGAVRAARGADGGTQVNADTTYYEFLKRQPAWFQDQALGETRGKIFRNSGISAEEFRVISVDGFGKPMTLEQMAALDKRVADYLKGE